MKKLIFSLLLMCAGLMTRAQEPVPFTIEALGRVYLNNNGLELSFTVKGEDISVTMTKVKNRQYVSDNFNCRFEDGKVVLVGYASGEQLDHPTPVTLFSDSSLRIGTVTYQPCNTEFGMYEGQTQAYASGISMPSPCFEPVYTYYDTFPQVVTDKRKVLLSNYMHLLYLPIASSIDRIDVYCASSGALRIIAHTPDVALKKEIESTAAQLEVKPAVRKGEPVAYVETIHLQSSALYAVVSKGALLYAPGDRVLDFVQPLEENTLIPVSGFVPSGTSNTAPSHLWVAATDAMLRLKDIKELTVADTSAAVSTVKKNTWLCMQNGTKAFKLKAGSKLPVTWRDEDWGYLPMGESAKAKVLLKDIDCTQQLQALRSEEAEHKPLVHAKRNRETPVYEPCDTIDNPYVDDEMLFGMYGMDFEPGGKNPKRRANVKEVASEDGCIHYSVTDSLGTVTEVVECSAQFPGGDAQCLKYINDNLHYPPTCLEKDIHARVMASFVIDENGKITNIWIVRSPDKDLSCEVRRVLRTMPQWKPATRDGKPIRAKYSTPVTFRL